MCNRNRIAACAFLAGACLFAAFAFGQQPGGAGDLPAWMSNAQVIDRRTDPEAYRAFLAKHARKYPPEGQFPTKMAQVALPADQLPRVIEGHPRMMIRREGWKYGLSLAELRARAKQAPWDKQMAGLARKWHCEPGQKKAMRWYDGIDAALYHLATGDDSVVPSLVDWILAVPTAGYGRGGWPFIVYDWIHDALTPEQREQLIPHLVKLARGAVSLQESPGNCGDVWRHRGGGAVDPLAAGLALYGECPEAAELLRMGMGYYRKGILPARQHTDGAWIGGGHSYDGAEYNLARALLCWASATDQDIFGIVRTDFGDWLQSRLYFWMSQVYPDKTRPEVIGTDYNPWKLIVNPEEFLIASRAYDNPDGYHFLRWLGQDPKASILLYSEKLEDRPASAAFSKPWSKLWGRRGTGYVQARSDGWRPDSTVVEFRCGDYFESHGHYANQNSFYIYSRGRLAVQAGVYDSFAKSEHWQHYYRRSIAANTMLVYQPGEWREGLGGKLFPAPGGQVADMTGYHNFTQAEYDWHLAHEPGWYDMGNITAYDHGPAFEYTYVCGDATNAYDSPQHLYFRQDGDRIIANRPKIDRFTRSLVYLPPSLVVIFDRVNALDAAYRKAWLLHSIGRPQISGKRTAAEVPGHIEDYDGDLVTITFDPEESLLPSPDAKAVGRLFVRSMLPAQRTIRRIGGPGYRFWSGGKNWLPGYDCWKPQYKGKGQDAGSWRIEISPAKPAAFDNFLNLIQVCDDRTAAPAPAAMVASEDDAMVGLTAGGWLVLFGRKGRVEGPIRYTAPEGKIEHLLVDLPPGARYRATGTAAAPADLTVGPEGVLRFATKKAGAVTLTAAR